MSVSVECSQIKSQYICFAFFFFFKIIRTALKIPPTRKSQIPMTLSLQPGNYVKFTWYKPSILSSLSLSLSLSQTHTHTHTQSLFLNHDETYIFLLCSLKELFFSFEMPPNGEGGSQFFFFY